MPPSKAASVDSFPDHIDQTGRGAAFTISPQPGRELLPAEGHDRVNLIAGRQAEDHSFASVLREQDLQHVDEKSQSLLGQMRNAYGRGRIAVLVVEEVLRIR